MGLIWGDIRPAGHFKVFAEIGGMLFRDRVGASIAALVRNPGIIADAVQADFDVIAALMTGITPPWLGAQRPLPSAVPAMACHKENLTIRCAVKQSARAKSCVEIPHRSMPIGRQSEAAAHDDLIEILPVPDRNRPPVQSALLNVARFVSRDTHHWLS